MFGNPVCKHCRQRHGTGYDCRLDNMKYSERTKALMHKLFFKTKRKRDGTKSATLTAREIEKAEARATRAYGRLIKEETGPRGSAANG